MSVFKKELCHYCGCEPIEEKTSKLCGKCFETLYCEPCPEISEEESNPNECQGCGKEEIFDTSLQLCEACSNEICNWQAENKLNQLFNGRKDNYNSRLCEIRIGMVEIADECKEIFVFIPEEVKFNPDTMGWKVRTMKHGLGSIYSRLDVNFDYLTERNNIIDAIEK